VLWIAMRAGTYGCTPMLVAIVFGLDPSWGMLLVPFIAFLGGLGWASTGIVIAGTVNDFENFNYVISAGITPLFLVAGTFFPLTGLPEWAQALANLNPLYHLVELVRHAVFGFEPGHDLVHAAVLVAFALLAWRLAIWRMSRRLIG